MATVIVTGSTGLVGSETVRHFTELGYDIVGIDNDMRRVFFGDDASTAWNRDRLIEKYPRYEHVSLDIRDRAAMEKLFSDRGSDVAFVVHTAAQPSHDWAARDPFMDFEVNANGTLTILDMTRRFAPNAPIAFTSTNKVYGDTPNYLPLIEKETRWEIDPSHEYADGIDETMSIDHSKHSLFGASKVAADVLVQEYGRYFGMKTACFRCGCITGAGHSGTALHGFLAYLMKCTVTGKPYTVFGYKAKQVRDNIHAADLVNAFAHFFSNPREAEVYNMGGARQNSVSMIEAIEMCEGISGKKLNWSYSDENRIGDHIWYISSLAKFQKHYPEWEQQYTLRELLEDIHQNNVDRWKSEVLK